MADAQLNLTRRALLGAACVPVLARHSGLDPESTFPAAAVVERGRWTPDQVRGDTVGSSAWQQALGAFRAAQAAVAEIEAATAGASLAEEGDWLPRHDAACDRMEEALLRAIALPAPDLGALAVKLELLFAHGIEPNAVDDAWLAAIREDALRLLREA
ncbi:MAG: hypothetical protein QOH04_1886 [Sphingomonadales bacterium]|jgi:hypothetical protein|nr:hypothetical protein [Sphingomonadales bacterium]